MRNRHSKFYSCIIRLPNALAMPYTYSTCLFTFILYARRCCGNDRKISLMHNGPARLFLCLCIYLFLHITEQRANNRKIVTNHATDSTLEFLTDA